VQTGTLPYISNKDCVMRLHDRTLLRAGTAKAPALSRLIQALAAISSPRICMIAMFIFFSHPPEQRCVRGASERVVCFHDPTSSSSINSQGTDATQLLRCWLMMYLNVLYPNDCLWPPIMQTA
jgi:hypothetical protein